MSIEKILQERSQNTCELCKSANDLNIYTLPPDLQKTEDNAILICKTCFSQLDKKAELDAKHWQCLLESMWSEVPAVQVASWRMLNRFKTETWAVDALDMMYLSDETLEWAKATGEDENTDVLALHKDTNGTLLQAGDTVTLIKDLNVKGSSLNAKIGTSVRNIRLDPNNHEQIEGKVDGQLIVILTKYVRKN